MALGLIAQGKQVTLVVTDPAETLLTDVVASFQGLMNEARHPKILYCWRLQDLALLQRALENDPDHFAIVDTAFGVSSVRSYAFEQAHFTVLPCSSLADATEVLTVSVFQLPAYNRIVAFAVEDDPLLNDDAPLSVRLLQHDLRDPDWYGFLQKPPIRLLKAILGKSRPKGSLGGLAFHLSKLGRELLSLAESASTKKYCHSPVVVDELFDAMETLIPVDDVEGRAAHGRLQVVLSEFVDWSTYDLIAGLSHMTSKPAFSLAFCVP